MLIFFYDTIINLLMLIILFHTLSLLTLEYRKRNYLKPLFNNTDEFKKQFLCYLDKYYIKKLFYTITAVVLYFFCHTGFLVIYRIISMMAEKKVYAIFPIDYDSFSLNIELSLILVIIILLSIVALIWFKIMVDNFFYFEVVKLHIFLSQYSFYCTITSCMIEYDISNIFGKIYLFFYNVSNSRVTVETTNQEYYSFFCFDTIYQNKYILYLSDKLIILVKYNKMFHVIVKIITAIFRWVYHNMRFDGLIQYIPYLLFAAILFYDLTQKKVYYMNYATFLLLFIILLMKYNKFLHKSSAVYTTIIAKYFYSSTFNYKELRLLIREDKTKFYNNIANNEKTNYFLRHIKDDLVDYLFCNCSLYFSRDPKRKKELSKLNSSYKRYYFCGLILLGVYYIIYTKNHYTIILPNIMLSFTNILLLLAAILCYSAINSYKPGKNNLDNFIAQYIYKKHLVVIFWIVFAIFAYICWLFIIKANVFLFVDGIIWDHLGITIKKSYTVEEKYLYFFDHLDVILTLLEKSGKDEHQHLKNTLLFLIEELNWKGFILEDTTIAETKQLVDNLLNLYLEQRRKYLEMLITTSLEYQKLLHKKAIIRSTMDCISNIANLVVFSKFFVYFLKGWHIVANPTSVETGKLAVWILTFMVHYIRRR